MSIDQSEPGGFTGQDLILNQAYKVGEDPLVCDYQLEEVTYENNDLGGTDFGPTIGHFFDQRATGYGAQSFFYFLTQPCAHFQTQFMLNQPSWNDQNALNSSNIKNRQSSAQLNLQNYADHGPRVRLQSQRVMYINTLLITCTLPI